MSFKKNSVYHFLMENGCFTKLKNNLGKDYSNENPTHYCYGGTGGGIIHVPDELYATFLSRCGDDVFNKNTFYLSEQRTEHFAMHVDFDLLRRRRVSKMGIMLLVRLFQQNLKQYYQVPAKDLESQFDPFDQAWEIRNDLFAVIVCTREASVIEDMTKTAIHLHMPNLIVNQERALQIRHTFLILLEAFEQKIASRSIADLMEMLGGEDCDEWLKRYASHRNTEENVSKKRFGWIKKHFPSQLLYHGDPWPTVVDQQVYDMNGLRMLYAKKMDKCKTCSGDKKTSCTDCMSRGKVEIDNCYVPILVMDHRHHRIQSVEKNLAVNFHSAIRLCSTHRNKGTPMTEPWAIPVDSSLFDYKSFSEKVGSRRRKVCVTEKELANMSHLQTGTNLVSYLSASDPRFQIIMNVIQTRGHPNYRRLSAKCLELGKNTTTYTLTVNGAGERYCNNKRGYHKSSPIYFVITKDGIVQRCRCRKVQQSDIYCHNYKSPPYQLTHEEVGSLFPANYDAFQFMNFEKNTTNNYCNFLRTYIKYKESCIKEWDEKREALGNSKEPVVNKPLVMQYPIPISLDPDEESDKPKRTRKSRSAENGEAPAKKRTRRSSKPQDAK